MRTEKELLEHLEHLEEEQDKYYTKYSKECNQSIQDCIEGAITTLKWVLEQSDVKAG